MMYKRLFLFFFLILIFLFFISFDDESILISAKIQPSTIYTNEEFKIIVTIESNKYIELQELPSFETIHFIKQLQIPTIEYFQESSYLSYKIYSKYIAVVTFYLICEEEIILQGSSLKFKINNKYHIIKDFYIPIISKIDNSGIFDVQSFISFNYDPKEIFIGQPFTCEYTIFSKQEIDKIEIMNLPIISGAVYQKIELQNNKDKISIFDEQINKYIILRYFVFPNSQTVSFDKFDVKITSINDNKKTEKTITISSKSLNINPLPYNAPEFFGLIGNYNVSYSYNRIEKENNIFYILEIIFKGKGNHQYVDFSKMKIKQDFFTIFGPDFSFNENTVVIDYYLYPKKTGFIFLNQIQIPIFNPEKKDYENFVIPKTAIYINQNLDQIFTSFNFSSKTIQFEDLKISNFKDYFSIVNPYYLIVILTFVLFIFILISSKPETKMDKNEINIYNEDIVSLWNYLTKKFEIQSYEDLLKFIQKENSKNKTLLEKVYKTYCSFFNYNSNRINSKELNKLTYEFKTYIKRKIKKNEKRR